MVINCKITQSMAGILKDEIKYRLTQSLFDISKNINTNIFENLGSFWSIWLKILKT